MNEEELIEDGELIATAEPITTDDIDNAILNPEPNKVTPTNTTGGKFPSAFGKKYGHSSVDLSIQDNEDKMLDEYNTWWYKDTFFFILFVVSKLFVYVFSTIKVLKFTFK